MQKINYVDAPEEVVSLKGKVGSAVFGLLGDLAKAKESGQKLPKFLDKVATLVVKGKKEGTELAKETVKEQIKIKLPIIIMGAVILGLLIYILTRK